MLSTKLLEVLSASVHYQLAVSMWQFSAVACWHGFL